MVRRIRTFRLGTRGILATGSFVDLPPPAPSIVPMLELFHTIKSAVM